MVFIIGSLLAGMDCVTVTDKLKATLGPFIFPYKRHISSKIRRGLAKTRLILEQPLTPVLT